MSDGLFSTRLSVSLGIGVRSAAVAFVGLGLLYFRTNSDVIVHSSPAELRAMAFLFIPPLTLVAGTIGMFITLMCSLVRQVLRRDRAETTGENKSGLTQTSRASFGPRIVVSALLGGSSALCLWLQSKIACSLSAYGMALGMDGLLVFICLVLVFVVAYFMLLSLLSWRLRGLS